MRTVLALRPGKGPADPATETYREAATQAAAEIGRINVLVAGNTGVGKSTLINAMFGGEVAPTGAGLPVTDTLTLYEAPDAPLNLWDSRGFEAGDREAVAAVTAKLKTMRSLDDVAAQIHVAWLCISSMSNRIEPVHLHFLSALAARGVPAIVVFTQTYRSMPADARAAAQPCAAQVEVLAQAEPAFQRPGFGLDALVDATNAVLPEARRAAFAAAQRVHLALKKSEARRVVAACAATAAVSAVAPGHSLVLGGMQAVMLAKIDRIFGYAPAARDLAAVKAVAGLGASQGGRWLFGAMLSDGLKTSGGGYAAGVAIGGAIGGAITAAMGYSYIEGLAQYRESGVELPVGDVAEMVLAAVRAAVDQHAAV